MKYETQRFNTNISKSLKQKNNGLIKWMALAGNRYNMTLSSMVFATTSYLIDYSTNHKPTKFGMKLNQGYRQQIIQSISIIKYNP